MEMKAMDCSESSTLAKKVDKYINTNIQLQKSIEQVTYYSCDAEY